MEGWSCFRRHLSERRLKEATVRAVEYQSRSDVVISFTDFGHINIHQISDLQRCPSKTLVHDNLPVYCSYMYESDSAQIIFSSVSLPPPSLIALRGGKDVIAWDWESLLACPHGKSPEGKYYRYGDPSSLRPLSETLCLTGNPQAGHLYSAGSEGVIHCHDIATGQEVHQFHGHRSAIHSLHFDPSSALLFSCDESCTVCVWGEPRLLRPGISSSLCQTRASLPQAAFSQRLSEDARAKALSLCTIFLPLSPPPSSPAPPGTGLPALSSPALTLSLPLSLGSAVSSMWCGAMVLEPGGNFLYLGGGYDFSPAPSSSLSGPANRCRSAGWIASVYLRRSELTASEQTIVTSSLLTAHPVQAMCFHGSDLITGGLVSGLRYYNTSPLGLSALSLPRSLSLPSLQQRRSPLRPQVAAL
jgi:WD40 repeat protein